jgi:hypothetical protein
VIGLRPVIAFALAALAVSARPAYAGDVSPFEVEIVRPVGGVWNEYANPGEDYPQSFGARLRGDVDGYDVSVEYRRNVYLTQSAGPASVTRYATLSGGYATVGPFLARDMELEARVLRRGRGPLALGAGAVQTWTNYGYPALRGIGIGIARLPQWTGQVSLSASAFYYPAATGSNGVTRATFAILKSDVSARFRPRGWRAYFVGGYQNEIRSGRHLPGGVRLIRSDPYVGIGGRT